VGVEEAVAVRVAVGVGLGVAEDVRVPVGGPKLAVRLGVLEA